MRNTLFIAPNTIKEVYPIVKNLDTNFIRPYILIAQERDVYEILGCELYNQLQVEIENENISVDNRKLIEDYISSLLMFSTFELMVEPSLVRLKNAGPVSSNGEYVNVVSHAEAVDLKKHYEENRNFYRKRLVDYLCCNRSKYPLYHCCEVKHKNIIPIV